MAIIKGTELGQLAEVVPGGQQSGDRTGLCNHGRGNLVPPVPPTQTIDFLNSLGATFYDTAGTIVVNSGGVVYNLTARTIQQVTLGFQPGIFASISFDIWVVPYGSLLTMSSSNSICGGNYPSISTANESKDAAMTSWNLDIPADSWVAFTCRSVSGAQWAVIQLDTVSTN